jgi:hypothetical protein
MNELFACQRGYVLSGFDEGSHDRDDAKRSHSVTLFPQLESSYFGPGLVRSVVRFCHVVTVTAAPRRQTWPHLASPQLCLCYPPLNTTSLRFHFQLGRDLFHHFILSSHHLLYGYSWSPPATSAIRLRDPTIFGTPSMITPVTHRKLKSHLHWIFPRVFVLRLDSVTAAYTRLDDGSLITFEIP